MSEVTIRIPYAPRPLQKQIHKSLKRYNVLVCHRRFGKTVLSINQIIKSAFECSLPDPRFAYIAPLYNQAKTVAWDYLKRYTANIPDVRINESELRVDLPWGARISLYGADNPDRLRGLYFDGVVLDEYADMSPRMWSEVLRPALSDRKGWVIFIGTPKGRNQFYDIYNSATKDPDWYAALFKASETKIVDHDELVAAAKDMTPEQYDQEFECSFQAALIGAYYGRELANLDKEKQIGNVPYEPGLPVYTAWDLGMHDSTAIWFAQIVQREVRLIDYYENSGMGLDHYAKVLDRKPYTYADHYLPHDAKVRELSSGRSRVETLESLGIKPFVVPVEGIEEGINAVRLLLPRCWFDVNKTEKGLEALRQYQREWDDKRRCFIARPRHDWTSHAADAFRYLALALPDRVTTFKLPQRSERSWLTA